LSAVSQVCDLRLAEIISTASRLQIGRSAGCQQHLSSPRWSPTITLPRSRAAQLKDQCMLRKILTLPALAGLFLVGASTSRATTITQDFAGDPLTNGWSVFGDAGLFVWNSTNQNLEVTWDSSQTNSYFCRRFGTSFTKASDFMLGFDLRLNDIAGGVHPNKPFPFQISVGLLNLAQATNAGFESPNLVEFNYFPAAIFEPTVSPVLISSNNEFSDGGFTFPLELRTNTLFHITMVYNAADRTLRTLITSNGVPFVPVRDCTLNTNFSDFVVDHFGVSSYCDVGQFPGFEGSVLAHGVVDNFLFAAPPPVTKLIAVRDGHAAGVQFRSTTNWFYALERTTNFQSWATASSAVAGTGGTLNLQDTNPPLASAYYRVNAWLP
jgi:hypothetical protein